MRAVVLGLIAACGASAPPESRPAPVATCSAVAAHIRVLVGDVTDHAHRVHDAVLARCTQDTWPEPARTCFVSEPDLHAGHRCQQWLAVDQRALLARDVEAVRLPPIEKLREPCTKFEELAQRIDVCAAVDTQTRAQLRTTSQRILAEFRGPTAGPATRPIDGAIVQRRINRPDTDGVVGGPPERDTSECRLGIDTLVKLGAEKCGW